MKKTVNSLVRCCAAAAVLLGGASVSEAAPITLVNGASSVELCLPGLSCGASGLSNWIAEGTAVNGFEQWFTGFIVSDPLGSISWSGALDTLPLASVTHTASTASVSFFDSLQKVGITIDYALVDLGGASHIQENFWAKSISNTDLYAGLSDGMNYNSGATYVHSLWDTMTTRDLGSVDYTPNPEPISMVLLGTGLLAVARSRRRKTEMMA